MGPEVFADTRAVSPQATGSRTRASDRGAALLEWLKARALFVVAVAAVVVLSLLGIPRHFSQDGWLALVAGRQIAAHGVPQHDNFTLMAHGVHWVDQQWLAQLLMYELAHVGGLQLLTVLYVLATGAAFAGGVAAARSLGGEDLHVLACLVPGAFFYLVTAVSIRTQGLAYPLFVLTLWLLASEARGASAGRRVYWVLPVLVVWANLHGSATLGAGMVALFALTRLAAGLRAGGPAALRDRRAWLLLVLSPLTLLATPYGLGMIHYYRATLMNSQFGRLVTEWKPVTSVPILAVPLALLIAATAYVQLRAFLRARSGTTTYLPLFDVILTAVLAFGAVTAVRNITWFGLGVVILLPAAASRMRGTQAPLRRATVNQLLAVAIVALTALTALVILGRPDSWFTGTYPTSSLPTLKALVARDPRIRIFADVRYADWLVWEDPKLFSGRVAYDTSLELLSTRQLDAIADPAARSASGRHGLLAGYGLWLLYPVNRTLNRELLGPRGPLRAVVRNRRIVIATRSRA